MSFLVSMRMLLFTAATFWLCTNEVVWLCIGVAMWLCNRLFRWIVESVEAGLATEAAVAVLCSTIIPLALIVVFIDGRDLSELTDVGKLPWSLVFGDLALAVGTYLVADARSGVTRERNRLPLGQDEPHLHRSPLGRDWQRLIQIGSLAAFALYHWSDSKNYEKMGHLDLTDSFAKLFHDFVGGPALLAAMIYLIILVIRYPDGRIMFLVFLTLWVFALVRDANAGLNPADFHRACDVACAGAKFDEWLEVPRQWLQEIYVLRA